jgi:ABC-type multidrug transport system fused ATPase/permease subunit
MTDTIPAENSLVPVKIGRYKASKTIVKEAWAILKQDKEIMGFPILSSVCTLVAALVMAVLYYFLVLGGSTETLQISKANEASEVVQYLTLLVYYFIIFFIVSFFQAGLFMVVQGRFSGQNLSFSDGLSKARENLSKIFLWALISATVGMILGIISDNFKLVGKIIASFLGAAWNILTYFSLPSLVIGKLGIKDSFKESAALIRKTWGEAIIINFGVGMFFAILIFLTIALSVGIIVIFPSMYVIVTIEVLFALFMIAIIVVSSTLSSIFKLALYNYARTGVVPVGFSADIIKAAVKGK